MEYSMDLSQDRLCNERNLNMRHTKTVH